MICQKCGKDAGDNKFCPDCGAEIGKEGTSPVNNSMLSENAASLLSYLCGWITGIIFMLIDKRPFVRFHAMQSILLFGSITILNIILSALNSFLPFGLWAITSLLNKILSLITLIAWVLMIVKSYQGQYYKLPILGDMAEKMSKSVKV